ncbi:MAG: heme-binding protein [Deltaproteobacteria bacterium]|nr:heme-binding protein [Deltaproteobacteria bacterium]
MTKLSLEVAQRLIAEARKLAGDKPIVVVVVVDVGGDLVAFEKMDRTGRTMGRVAIGKAYTAVMAAKAKENPLFWQSVAAKDPGPFIFARGGAPLIHDGEVQGAVGVSGPSPQFSPAHGCVRAST